MNSQEALKYLQERHGITRTVAWLRVRTGAVGTPGKLFPTRRTINEASGNAERVYDPRELDAVAARLPKSTASAYGGSSGSGVGNVLGTQK